VPIVIGWSTTTIYHELTTTTIVSQSIRRTIRASESPQSGYILGQPGSIWTPRSGCKVLLISGFQVRVLGGSLTRFGLSTPNIFHTRPRPVGLYHAFYHDQLKLAPSEAESIEERRERIEIHASIEERLKEYVPVFQELLDEGAIRLDGQPALLAGENRDKGENGEDEMLTYDEPDDE
jgi:hypothetical protein